MDLCERLPWWEGWLGPTLSILAALVVPVPAFWFVRARAREAVAASATHWTERARLAMELRSTALSAGVWALVVLWWTNSAWRSASGCSHTSIAGSAGTFLVTALLFQTYGAIDASYRGTVRALGERLRSLATVIIAYQPGISIVVVSVLAGGYAPTSGWIWAWVAGVAVIHTVAGTGVVYALARPLGLAWPARDRVRRAVERARGELPTPVRGVDEIAWLMPNALVLPLSGKVAFTKAAADAMSDDELFAIALHELGHLHESALVRYARPLRSLFWTPYSVAVPLYVSGRTTALLVLFGVSLVLSLASMRLSRHDEKEADAHAAAHAPGYARALESLYRLAGVPAVLQKRSTHPALYDRMLAAGVTPDFPRPKPPSYYRSVIVIVAAGCFTIGASVAVSLGRLALEPVLGVKTATLVRVAVQGEPSDVMDLAFQTRDPTLASLLYQKAVTDDPTLAPSPEED